METQLGLETSMKKRYMLAQLILGLVGSGLAMAESDLTDNLVGPPACACQQSACPDQKACAADQCAAKDGCEDENACGEEKKCRWCHCGQLGDAWKLPEPCCVKQAGFDISGWVQSGIITNSHGAGSNGPLGFNNLTDFNLHQGWIYAERKTDTEKNCFDWGGRVDYVYGVDGPDTQAFGDQGWDYGWNSSSRYGSAIPQLYLDLAYGDWTIRGGHFYTPMGYEVVPATGNFFFTHSYMMYYAECFTHTGFLVTRKLNDKLTVSGGWVDGWDSGWENRNHESTFLGGATLTCNEKNTFSWVVTAGDWGNGAVTTQGDIYMNSLVYTHKFNDKWTYVLQHDLGSNTNNPAGDAQWYGLSNYLLRKITDCLSAGARIEWFRDDDGVRVVGGNEGSYYEATLGLNYKPHANLLFRPEVRWDWYEGSVAADNHPFNDGRSDSQLSGGFDMIFTF
jgi:hypothetical protein